MYEAKLSKPLSGVAPCGNCGKQVDVPLTGEVRHDPETGGVAYYVKPGLSCECGEPLEVLTVKPRTQDFNALIESFFVDAMADKPQ